MESNDTIHLLKECDAGTKMAVASINEVIGRVSGPDMRKVLIKSKDNHEKLGDEIHSKLIELGSEDKDPNPMAKGMSWMKTNVKMSMNQSDATVADLITDGCNMGVKSLHKYLNQYRAADANSKSICMRLADIEEQLCRDLREYL